jgi:hypothetical protein
VGGTVSIWKAGIKPGPQPQPSNSGRNSETQLGVPKNIEASATVEKRGETATERRMHAFLELCSKKEPWRMRHEISTVYIPARSMEYDSRRN